VEAAPRNVPHRLDHHPQRRDHRLVQALALWPGVSRSLVTIVAALALGYSMAAALEFSFLLGLATLSAATALDLAKDGHTLLSITAGGRHCWVPWWRSRRPSSP